MASNLLKFSTRAAALVCVCLCAASVVYSESDTTDELGSIENEALTKCEERGFPSGKPTHPFTTDICSAWPDGNWGQCCVEHDMDYWCGGSREDRSKSDRRLRACVSDNYAAWMGLVMRVGVYFGGSPWVPANWRWGYGHPYPSRYTPR